MGCGAEAGQTGQVVQNFLPPGIEIAILSSVGLQDWPGSANKRPARTIMDPTFTLGIEEEYQTVDPITRDLRSHIQVELLEKGKLVLQERVKAEMHQSVVEVGTGVCETIKEAKAEVKMLRRDIIRLAK